VTIVTGHGNQQELHSYYRSSCRFVIQFK